MSNERIFVPKDIWFIITTYLESEKLKSDIERRERKLHYDKKLVDECFKSTVTRLLKTVKCLRNYTRKINNGISYSHHKQYKRFIADMDNYSINIHNEIQSLFSVIQKLQDVEHKLNSCIIES